MKNLLICFVWVLTFGAHASAQVPDDPITIGKKIKIESSILHEAREIWISTPSSYGTAVDSFPVIYLLDGDDHFHHTTGTAGYLAGAGRIPQAIVVAIPNTDRTRDLTPVSQNPDDIQRLPNHGGADNFLRFMSDELIPFVDDNYRTKPYRVLIGHSFGGLFAIHALTTRPDIFNGYIAISPSLQWSDQGLVAQAENFFNITPKLEADLYMTTGNEGGALTGGTRKLAGILEESAPREFRWDVNYMIEESHSSVPLRSTRQGLEAIFNGWYLHDPVPIFNSGGMDAVERYFLEGGKRFGYDRTASPLAISQLVVHLVAEERLNEAATILLKDTERPPSSSLLDYLAAAYAEAGDQNSAADLYATSLRTHPGNANARKKLIELGGDVEALVPAVVVAPELLQGYAGKYEFRPDFVLTVELEGSELSASTSGQTYTFRPISDIRFAFVGADAQLEFVADQDGGFNKLMLFQNGQVLNARRIE